MVTREFKAIHRFTDKLYCPEGVLVAADYWNPGKSVMFSAKVPHLHAIAHLTYIPFFLQVYDVTRVACSDHLMSN